MADEKPLFADPEMERAKAWWHAHGGSIIVGVALGLAGVVGFNYWQSYQQTRAENASILFAQLRLAIQNQAAEAEAAEATADDESADEAAAEAEASDESTAESTAESIAESIETEADSDALSPTITVPAEDLMADYSATPYATHAAFALAKAAAEGGDLARAAEALRWAVDNSDDDNLSHMARLRLASVLLWQGDAVAAESVLAQDSVAGFAARYHELRGDAKFQQDDLSGAREAYQSSMEALPPTASKTLLQLKLDNLSSAP